MTRGRRRMVLSAVVVCLLAGCVADDAPPEPDPTSGGEAIVLSQPRAVHRAVGLPDGTVLLVGGCATRGCGGFEESRTSEVVDPATGRSRPGPVMGEPRASGTATTLPDGRVLLAGGYPGEGRGPTSGMELFDPETASFSPAGSLRFARADHSATVLPDGRVMVVGGFGADGAALTSVEVVDPVAGTVGAGPALPEPRAGHGAVVVDDRLVVVGGTSQDLAVPTTVVLQAATWVDGPQLRAPRVKHAVAALPGGRALVVGGSTTIEGRELLRTTELLTLASGTSPGSVADGPSLASGQYKLDGAVVPLPDGRVVIAGGPRVEVFDPTDWTMTTVEEEPQPRRSFVTATVVGERDVLVAGGYDADIVPTASARVVTVPRRP